MQRPTRADSPHVIVIGGPNGAGKTTSAWSLLPAELATRQFVNADTIAAGLSAFAPETAAFEAGRVKLRRLQELALRQESFAFETTLASRSFAPFLRSLREQGYSVQVIYVWLERPELAVRRVADRVRRGGHAVPPDVMERRYWRGLRNFLGLYAPLADTWLLCDNSGDGVIDVARGGRDAPMEVLDAERYARVRTTGTGGSERLEDGPNGLL